MVDAILLAILLHDDIIVWRYNAGDIILTIIFPYTEITCTTFESETGRALIEQIKRSIII